MKTNKVLTGLLNLADVHCNDELQMNQFCIRPNLAADEDYSSSNYCFLDEIVKIEGIDKKIGDIISKNGIANLRELENYLSKYGFHISWVYE